MTEHDKQIRELTEAIRLTVEYVGTDTLPPIPGWSWYDALVKHDPATAAAFVESHQKMTEGRVQANQPDIGVGGASDASLHAISKQEPAPSISTSEEIGKQSYDAISAGKDDRDIPPHEYEGSYSGMVCGALVLVADEHGGHGDQCGRRYDDPVHQIHQETTPPLSDSAQEPEPTQPSGVDGYEFEAPEAAEPESDEWFDPDDQTVEDPIDEDSSGEETGGHLG